MTATMSDKFNVEWNAYQTVWRRSLTGLRLKNEFADVTLVTEDKMKFPTHKILLSSCSNVLKFILKDNIQWNSHVYLSSIDSRNLGFILDYIYCGEVKLFQEQLAGFLECAKKLEIEGLLNEDTNDMDEQTISDPLDNNQEQQLKVQIEMEILSRRKSFSGDPAFNVENMTAEEVEMKRKQLYATFGGVWFCLACEYDSKDRSNIKRHIGKHIKGLKDIKGLSYACTLCRKEFKSNYQLHYHTLIVHKYDSGNDQRDFS